MKTIDILGISFGNFKRRKLRSVLTVSGVVIGTASIVVMMSLGIAISKSFTDSYSSMGDLTAINVYTGWDENTGMEKGKLDDELVETLKGMDNVAFVSPELRLSGKIVTGRYELYSSIKGIDMSNPDVLGLEIEQGTLLTDDMKKLSGKKLYAVFGSEAPYQFSKKSNRGGMSMSMSYGGFGGGDTEEKAPPEVDVMDENTRMKYTFDYSYGNPNRGSAKQSPLYTMVAAGVLKAKNGNNDYSVLVDLSVAKEIRLAENKFNDVKGSKAREINYDNITVYADSIENTTVLIKEITELGYQAWGIGSMLEEVQKQMGMIQALLGAIGSVSLIVAAIGITNTMIMSIYERTREIGIMKVIGCYLKDIRTMFLVEAGFIGLFGGLVGIGLSYLLSMGMNNLASSGMMTGMGMGGSGAAISIIPPWLALLAIVFAILVALISGFFPARRAMRLSALEAMRN